MSTTRSRRWREWPTDRSPLVGWIACLPATKARGCGQQRCKVRSVGVLLGLDTSINLLLAFPGYREIMDFPPAERAAQMRDSERRARVLSEPAVQQSVPGSSIPPLMDLVVAQFDRFSVEMFPYVEVNRLCRSESVMSK